MHRVALNALCKLLPDRAFRGVGRIGSPHHITPLLDGVLPLQHQRYNRTLAHKGHQAAIERAFFVDGVEGFGYGLCNTALPEPDNLEAVALNEAEDRAGVTVGDRVGFDDSK